MSAPMQAEIQSLRLTEPFRIAHGSSSVRQVLRIRWDGAIGEAPFVPYYQDDPVESMRALSSCDSPHDATKRDLPRVARLALEVLLLDHRGRRAGLPAWKLAVSAASGPLPPGCRSLGIPDDLDAYAEKVRFTNRQFRVLKLKLGSGNTDFDEAVVARARVAAPHATLFADVNGGWSAEEAASLIPRLARWNLEFIEQPVHHGGGIEAWRELNGRLPRRPMPLFADESAQTSADVPRLAGLVDGVNVKLLKCVRLDEVSAMIAAARTHGLNVLLGCMIESSVGVTAAAQFARLADWIDLDGHLYVADDDYCGISYDAEGNLLLPDGTGLGLTPR